MTVRPHLVRWHEEFAEQGLVLLEISRGREEPLDTIHQLARKNGVRHPLLWDEDCRNNERYGIRSYPTSYLIGADGRVFWEGNAMRTLGRANEAAELRALLQQKLADVVSNPQADTHDQPPEAADCDK